MCWIEIVAVAQSEYFTARGGIFIPAIHKIKGILD